MQWAKRSSKKLCIAAMSSGSYNGTPWSYMELLGAKESCKELQGTTTSCKDDEKEVLGNCQELKGALGSCEELHGASRNFRYCSGYRALQWATGAARSYTYREIQGAHGSYKGLKKLKGSFGRRYKKLQGARSFREL